MRVKAHVDEEILLWIYLNHEGESVSVAMHGYECCI